MFVGNAYENVKLHKNMVAKSRTFKKTPEKKVVERLVNVPYTHEQPYVLRHEDGRLWQHTMKGRQNVIPIRLEYPKEKPVIRLGLEDLPEAGEKKKKRRDTAIRDSLADDIKFKCVDATEAWCTMEEDFLTGTTVVFPQAVHKRRLCFCCMCQMGRKYHEPCPLQPDIGNPGRDNDDDEWMLPGTECPPFLEAF